MVVRNVGQHQFLINLGFLPNMGFSYTQSKGCVYEHTVCSNHQSLGLSARSCKHSERHQVTAVAPANTVSICSSSGAMHRGLVTPRSWRPRPELGPNGRVGHAHGRGRRGCWESSKGAQTPRSGAPPQAKADQMAGGPMLMAEGRRGYWESSKVHRPHLCKCFVSWIFC